MHSSQRLLTSFVSTSFISILCLAPCSTLFAAATVNYQGFVFTSGSTPAAFDFAIAGTFTPSFDPNNYSCVYGSDNFCNMNSTQYSHAVADGNFLPIGAGTLTNASGGFDGTGTTNAPTGTPIYLFLFNNPNPDAATLFALATSSNPFYRVPSGGGTTTLFASQANSFVFGFPGGNGIVLNSFPIPEPSTLSLAALGFALLLGMQKCRKRAAT
jgi:hypothetical protein